MGRLREMGQAIGVYVDHLTGREETIEESTKRTIENKVIRGIEAERAFLTTTAGVVDELKQIAKKVPGAQVGISKPSMYEPMNVVMVFNPRRVGADMGWDSVVVGVVSDSKKGKRLTVNEIEVPSPAQQSLKDTLQDAVCNPLHRREGSLSPRFRNEFLMVGRKKVASAKRG